METRAVDVGDEELLLAWRNDPDTRAQSLSSTEITDAEHCGWFSALLDDETRLALIGEVEGTPIGSVRIEPRGAAAVISVVIAPSARGNGLAVPLIEAAVSAWCLRSRSDVIAEIKASNVASARAFSRAGFREVAETDELIVMEYSQ